MLRLRDGLCMVLHNEISIGVLDQMVFDALILGLVTVFCSLPIHNRQLPQRLDLISKALELDSLAIGQVTCWESLCRFFTAHYSVLGCSQLLVQQFGLASSKIAWLLIWERLSLLVTAAANALEIPDGLEADFILLWITLLDSLFAALVANRCNRSCSSFRLQGTVANIIKMVDHFFF